MSEDIEDLEEPEEDYDYDFSLYDSDEDADSEEISTLKSINRPLVTGLRSKYSPGEENLRQHSELKRLIIKYSILVGEYSQEYSILIKFFSILNEYWEGIRYVYGTALNEDILAIKKHCKDLLNTYRDGTIPKKVHNNLLYYRSQIQLLEQLSNLGIETEKSARGFYSRAKQGITQ